MTVILKMYHPDLKSTGECTEESFRGVYQFRGWTLQGAAEDFASAHLGKAVGTLDDLTQDELYQVAVATGYTGNKVAKAKLATEIKGLVPGGDAPAVVAVIGEDDVIDPTTGEQMTAAEAEQRRLAADTSSKKG